MVRNGTKRYSFPRKYSKGYCIKTKCSNMGFTQRSSCRPYKNCFRKGTSRRTLKIKKVRSKTLKRT